MRCQSLFVVNNPLKSMYNKTRNIDNTNKKAFAIKQRPIEFSALHPGLDTLGYRVSNHKATCGVNSTCLFRVSDDFQNRLLRHLLQWHTHRG